MIMIMLMVMVMTACITMVKIMVIIVITTGMMKLINDKEEKEGEDIGGRTW